MLRFVAPPIIAGLVLIGCTPTYDWRVVSSEEYQWSALFPAKPVQVSRTITLPDLDEPIKLTLRSAKIGQSMFAVGWVVNEAGSLSTKAQDPKKSKPLLALAEKTRAALEAAMLKNLQYDAATLRRLSLKAGPHLVYQLHAKGSMPASQGSTPKAAELWMRSIALPNDAALAIEILAIGPEDELNDEIALQFIESLKLR